MLQRTMRLCNVVGRRFTNTRCVGKLVPACYGRFGCDDDCFAIGYSEAFGHGKQIGPT